MQSLQKSFYRVILKMCPDWFRSLGTLSVVTGERYVHIYIEGNGERNNMDDELDMSEKFDLGKIIKTDKIGNGTRRFLFTQCETHFPRDEGR